MQLGVSSFGVGLGTRATVTLAKAAEAAGFARFMLVERMLTNDAMVQLAAVAAVTERIDVGTGIVNIHLRQPDMLAAAAIAIDDLAPGRLVLGLGPNNRATIEAAGLPWRPPGEALSAVTARLRDVFAGREGRSGPAGQLIALPWAAVGLGTVERGGREADGVMLYLADPARIADARTRFVAAASEAGRNAGDLECSLLLPVFLDDDVAVARAAARNFLATYARLPHYRTMFAASGLSNAAGDDLSDALIDAIVAAGPADRCRARLAELAALGLTHVDLAPLPTGGRDLTASAERLLTELAPS